MPSKKKQKLSQQEKARRKLRSHSDIESNKEYKNLKFDRESQALFLKNRTYYFSTITDELRRKGVIDENFRYVD